MLTKKQLEEKIKKWDGVNKYIVRQARLDLREGNYEDSEEAFKEEEKIDIVKELETAKFSESDLMLMNKESQIDLLTDLGVKKIPRLEKQRVQLILDLQ